MNINELMNKLREFLPHSTLDEDNDGQIVVYTNLKVKEESKDEELVSIEEEK